MSLDRKRQLVEASFAPKTHPLYAALLSTAKGRRKFISGLAHPEALDAGFVRSLPPGEQNIDAMHKETKWLGAPTFCHVVSENARINRRQVTLREALERIVAAGMATLVCCVPDRLAYFGGEGPGEGYVRARGGAGS